MQQLHKFGHPFRTAHSQLIDYSPKSHIISKLQLIMAQITFSDTNKVAWVTLIFVTVELYQPCDLFWI